MRRLTLIVPLVFGLASCSSDSGTPDDFYKGGTVDPPVEGTDFPTGDVAEYPAGPYGYKVGSVLANYSFLGWKAPSEAGYDEAKIEKVQLADFYDPDGKRDVRYILMNSTARWCSACKYEYRQMQQQETYKSYRAKGVEFIGTILEGNVTATGAPPATPADLKWWASEFEVEFAFLLDPAVQLGPFFRSDAFPMNMIVDARTMQVVDLMIGGEISEMLLRLDDLLAGG
jgi:hypothetical protein